jgi:hypothetical protein
MRNRLIAVIVLASLAGSAMPISLLTAVEAMAMPGTASRHAATKRHSCCPGVHAQMASAVFLTFDPAAMPCGGQHPCCAKQTPENLPSLPAASQRVTRDPSAVAVTIAGEQLPKTFLLRDARAGHRFEFYSLRTTVLRI